MLAKIEMSASGLLGADGSPMHFTTPREWLALIAKYPKEQESADWLKRERFYAYWPCYLRQVNGGGARSQRLRKLGARSTPLDHPRVSSSWLAPSVQRFQPHGLVETIPGLISYMRDGAGHPAVLTNDDIETMRRIEAGQNLPPPGRKTHRFKIGDKVRFVDDLMGRWPPGKIGKLADDGRISVDVALLGRVVPIEVEPHQIEMM
jgi:hypothetical protein